MAFDLIQALYTAQDGCFRSVHGRRENKVVPRLACWRDALRVHQTKALDLHVGLENIHTRSKNIRNESATFCYLCVMSFMSYSYAS